MLYCPGEKDINTLYVFKRKERNKHFTDEITVLSVFNY